MHPIPGSSTSFCVGVNLCDAAATPAEGCGVLHPPVDMVDCIYYAFLSVALFQYAMRDAWTLGRRRRRRQQQQQHHAQNLSARDEEGVARRWHRTNARKRMKKNSPEKNTVGKYPISVREGRRGVTRRFVETRRRRRKRRRR